jgi:flagellar basal body-associated protein FliL
MSPASAPEKTGASGQYYSMPSQPARRMMSPMGYLGLGLAMIVTIVIVFRAASSVQGGGTTTPVGDGYETVDLGTFTRELSAESGGLVRDPFMLKVVVVLNPKVRERGAAKAQVERKRELFRDIVWDQILDSKSDAELRKPAVIETLKTEIRQRINKELGGTKDGEEMISRVIFPERRLPERR